MMIQPTQLYGFVVVASLLMTKNLLNPRNPWLINDLRIYKALYCRRETITDVMSALQINLFMQNKPNFKKSQINATDLLTRYYDKMDTWSSGKNKPNSKPIQTQFKPNTKPKQSQFKPKQTQFYNPVYFQSPIFPQRLLNNRINRICCVCSSSVSFDSAKMALYKGNWNLNKYGRKILNLLSYKSLSGSGRVHALTGTLFAYSYVGIFVLNN
jgi:hypothetical protein